jgi:hypothetical protein
MIASCTLPSAIAFNPLFNQSNAIDWVACTTSLVGEEMETAGSMLIHKRERVISVIKGYILYIIHVI